MVFSTRGRCNDDAHCFTARTKNFPYVFIPCAVYINDGYTLFAYYIQNYIFRKPIPDYFTSRDIPAGNLL